MVHLPLTINVIFCKELWPDPQLLKANEVVSTYIRELLLNFLFLGKGNFLDCGSESKWSGQRVINAWRPARWLQWAICLVILSPSTGGTVRTDPARSHGSFCPRAKQK